jgi:hypothetical protein
MTSTSNCLMSVGCCLLSILLPTAAAGAKKPIPNGPDAYTAGKSCEDMMRAREHVVRLYLKHTKDPKQIQDKAVEFIRAAHRRLLPVQQEGGWQELAAVGKGVMEAGSNDPVVEGYYAWLSVKSLHGLKGQALVDKVHEAERAAVSASKKYKQHGYPDGAGWQNAQLLVDLAHMDPGLRVAFLRAATEQGAAMVGDKSIPATDQRMVLFDLVTFCKSLSFPERKRFVDACAKQPGADPWTLDMLKGLYFKDLAWDYRGCGWADSVTPETGEKFHENLKLSAECLGRAWKVRPQFPEASEHMIAIAMAGEGQDSPREWFDRAVAAQMDYAPAYLSLMNALLPRWGGSHKEIYALGRECLATKRFDTLVPLLYFDAVIAIDNERGGKGDSWKHPAVYAGAKTCLEGMLREPDGKVAGESHAKFLSRYAAVAILAEEFADARRALDRLGDRVDLSMLQYYGISVPDDTARAYALTGSQADAVREVEKLLDGDGKDDPGTLKKAMTRLEAAAKKNTDKAAAPYFTARLASLKIQRDFDAGDWIDLTFEKDLAGWRSASGEWKSSSERKVEGRSSDDGRGFYLLRNLRLAKPFEVEVDLSWDARVPPGLHAGIVVGTCAIDSKNTGKGRFFGYSPGNRTYIAFAGDEAGWGKRVTRPSNPAKLHVKVWENRYAFYINDELEVDKTDETFRPEDVIGIGTGIKRNSSELAEAAFSNLRVRKLQEKPAADH